MPEKNKDGRWHYLNKYSACTMGSASMSSTLNNFPLASGYWYIGTSNFLRDILLPEHCTDEYQHGHAPPRSVLPHLPQNWVIQVSLASVPHLATSTLKFSGGFCCRDHANIHAGFPCAGQSSHFVVQALPPVSSRSAGARRFRLFFHYWSQVRSILWKVSRSMSCSKTN